MRYYSTREVAAILGGDRPLATVTVQKMVEKGVFPNARRRGRGWRIPECDLTEDLRALYAGGARPSGGRGRSLVEYWLPLGEPATSWVQTHRRRRLERIRTTKKASPALRCREPARPFPASAPQSSLD